ncbi:MAG: hypothetical protein VZQ83_04460 [Eubacterium sp.]|nr:hypothetical protein [Eubacterium sp.]
MIADTPKTAGGMTLKMLSFMHGNRRRMAVILLILLTLPLQFFSVIVSPHNQIYAASRVQVYDRSELKEELNKNGRAVIEVMETITVRETLRVRGTKVLKGPGEIRRAVAANSAFGGSLLRVTGGTLTLKNITLNGRGDAAVLSGKLYGYLVQVDGGQLLIGSGTVLKSNCNTTRLSDGGGAVRIGSGGVAVLSGGTITDNACVTGGAGVRVDGGGVFSMKSGVIKNNKVVARGAENGFDGRGGGIYNRGTVDLYGGTITGNRVSEYRKGARRYGGVGGGIANAGSLLIQGVSLRGNSGTRGRDLALIAGNAAAKGRVSIGECWIKSGRRLQVGGGFKVGSKIRLVPEKEREGTQLVVGLGGGNWKTWFTFPASVRTCGLEPVIRDGVLRLRERRVAPTPTPVPAPTATRVPDGGAGGSGSGDSGGSISGGSGSAGGSGGALRPAQTESPRAHPTYLPVEKPDPMADYFFSTRTPIVQPAVTPVRPIGVPGGWGPVWMPGASQVPSPVPTQSAPVHTWVASTPAPTQPVATPTPAQVRPSRTLPYFYLFAPTRQAGAPAEIAFPSTWQFSAQDIRRIREELKEGDAAADPEAFLKRIEPNKQKS